MCMYRCGLSFVYFVMIPKRTQHELVFILVNNHVIHIKINNNLHYI